MGSKLMEDSMVLFLENDVIGGYRCPLRKSNDCTINLLKELDADYVFDPASGKEIVQ